jgi:uncharacterized protein with HEPN domain
MLRDDATRVRHAIDTHRLAHGYFDIDLDVVWVTVTQRLPELRTALEKSLLT